MSSHDMSVRCSLSLKPGVTVAALMTALDSFMTEFNKELDGSAVGDFGEVPFADPDDSLELTASGKLSMSLFFHGPGHGIAPDCVEGICDALDEMVEGGGAVEFIDHDTSASISEAVAVRFVGETEAAKNLAQVNYGLEQAREWLEGVLSPEVLARVESTARGGVHAG